MSDQNSVGMQKQRIAAYAEKDGCKIVRWYEERPKQASKGEK